MTETPTVVPSPTKTTPAPPHAAGGGLRRRLRSRPLGILLTIAVVAASAGWGSSTPDVADVKIASTVLMYVALAEGWNLLGGYAGYINFGTVIFLGLGAYTTAIISAQTGISPLYTAPIATAVTGGAALLVGIAGFRLRGDYFAVATFVLTLALQQLAALLHITGGASGKSLKPTDSSLDGSIRLFFLLFLGLALLSVAICWLVEHTRWFSALVAIREDEDAAEVLGVPTLRVKLTVLAIGSAIAGLAGCFYAAQLGYLEPTGTFDFQVSLAVVVAAVIGGSGSWYGPLIGAVITQVLAQELFVRIQGVWNQIVFGALLIVVVLVAPHGLAKLFKPVGGRRFGV